MKLIKYILKSLTAVAMLMAVIEVNASKPDTRLPYRINRVDISDHSADLKPVIDSISEPLLHWDEFNFSAEFTVYFHGTDRIRVVLEHQYDFGIIPEYYEGPGMAHVKTGIMSGLYYNWVHIEASNEYGSTKKLIEFPPFFMDTVEEVEDRIADIEVNGQSVSIRCSSELQVSISTLDGRTVYRNAINEDTEIPLSRGIYIVNAKNLYKSLSKKIMIR